jgi:hypothetical protein
LNDGARVVGRHGIDAGLHQLDREIGIVNDPGTDAQSGQVCLLDKSGAGSR